MIACVLSPMVILAGRREPEVAQMAVCALHGQVDPGRTSGDSSRSEEAAGWGYSSRRAVIGSIRIARRAGR